MKKLCYLVGSALALSAMATPASAAEYIFNFSTNERLFGQSVAGSGIFTTSDTPTTVGGTVFSILSISGMVNGSAIVAPNTGTTYGNYFTTGGSFLDGSGTTFFTAAGNRVDFFQQSSNGRYRVNTFSPGSSNYVTATSSQVMAAVPEPATWLMMLLGFGGIGFLMRSKANQTVRVRYA